MNSHALSSILNMQFSIFNIGFIFLSIYSRDEHFKQFKYHSNKRYFITIKWISMHFCMGFQSIANLEFAASSFTVYKLSWNILHIFWKKKNWEFSDEKMQSNKSLQLQQLYRPVDCNAEWIWIGPILWAKTKLCTLILKHLKHVHCFAKW